MDWVEIATPRVQIEVCRTVATMSVVGTPLDEATAMYLLGLRRVTAPRGPYAATAEYHHLWPPDGYHFEK